MSTRKSMLARIHILRKELALPDADYRGILLRGFGVTSAKDLQDEDLSQAIATFEGMTLKRPSLPDPGNHKKSSKKIWVEWYELKPCLDTEKRGVDYLAGIARRHAPGLVVTAGKLDFDAVTPDEAQGIIRALKQANRHAQTKAAEVPF